MGLVECTAIIEKGLEALGFTSCLSGTGVADARIDDETRSSDDRRSSENIVSKGLCWSVG